MNLQQLDHMLRICSNWGSACGGMSGEADVGKRRSRSPLASTDASFDAAAGQSTFAV
jgi:hypothetical protein